MFSPSSWSPDGTQLSAMGNQAAASSRFRLLQAVYPHARQWRVTDLAAR